LFDGLQEKGKQLKSRGIAFVHAPTIARKKGGASQVRRD
jgi:hypothetical protein